MTAPNGALAQGSTHSVTVSVLEQRVNHLLACIQPNAPSELRRMTIGSYVCDLIRRCFAPQRQVEAFMFGSVPLRTYLPDGDIDISMFTPLRDPSDQLKDTWGTQLLKALEREAGRHDAPFRIRNCQIIQAEVKLVKFVVADVVVDVSFNAIGGLSTVAFLEWADRTIGKAHLFKRSIVLIKAWCYYESRLLGAHHGLISSYALETMVLHLFNLYGGQLTSPLQVFHQFLQVFAEFEWEKYALSILGPIPLDSYPHPTLALDVDSQSRQLLDLAALRDAVRQYSMNSTAAVEALESLLGSLARSSTSTSTSEGELLPTSFALPVKNLNIVDPLLPTNNLGRSVSKASFSRIKRALAFGAAQLQRVMHMEPLAASEGIVAYFKNTWRSPVRMAADNQMFQSTLSMATMVASGHRYRGKPYWGTYGGSAANAAPEFVATDELRSFSKQSKRYSSAPVVSGDYNEGFAADGIAHSAESYHEAGSPNDDAGRVVQTASTIDSGEDFSSQPATPSLSPRAGAPTAIRSPSVAQSTTAPGEGLGSFGSASYPVHVASTQGRRGAYHTSLPPSPLLERSAVVELGPSHRTGHSVEVPAIAVGPFAGSVGSDIFTSDLGSVMGNLAMARKWQPPVIEVEIANDDTRHPPLGVAEPLMDLEGGDEATDGILRVQRVAQNGDMGSPDVLAAAMASLQPVRLASRATIVAESYASVTAQGLTPLTNPNSRTGSGVGSASSSIGGTPRATAGVAEKANLNSFKVAGRSANTTNTNNKTSSQASSPTHDTGNTAIPAPIPRLPWGRGSPPRGTTAGAGDALPGPSAWRAAVASKGRGPSRLGPLSREAQIHPHGSSVVAANAPKAVSASMTWSGAGVPVHSGSSTPVAGASPRGKSTWAAAVASSPKQAPRADNKIEKRDVEVPPSGEDARGQFRLQAEEFPSLTTAPGDSAVRHPR